MTIQMDLRGNQPKFNSNSTGVLCSWLESFTIKLPNIYDLFIYIDQNTKCVWFMFFF